MQEKQNTRAEVIHDLAESRIQSTINDAKKLFTVNGLDDNTTTEMIVEILQTIIDRTKTEVNPTDKDK